MSRWWSTIAIATGAMVAMRAEAAVHEVPPPGSACEASANPGDSREVTCPVVATGALQRFEFTVTFVGGHDDTKASIAVRLDGAPFDCEPGSKTSLYGEDGEVSLACRFALTAPAASRHAFAAEVIWTHAQYKAFAFVVR